MTSSFNREWVGRYGERGVISFIIANALPWTSGGYRKGFTVDQHFIIYPIFDIFIIVKLMHSSFVSFSGEEHPNLLAIANSLNVFRHFNWTADPEEWYWEPNGKSMRGEEPDVMYVAIVVNIKRKV